MMTFPVWIESRNGQFAATLVGAPAIRAVGPTRAEALAALQTELALRYVEGWSTAAVAEALGLTAGSVKRHLFRAVRRLRQTLGGEA